MYFVFDCTTLDGYAFSTPFKWVARLGSHILTKATGRVHDYENMASAYSDPHR